MSSSDKLSRRSDPPLSLEDDSVLVTTSEPRTLKREDEIRQSTPATLPRAKTAFPWKDIQRYRSQWVPASPGRGDLTAQPCRNLLARVIDRVGQSTRPANTTVPGECPGPDLSLFYRLNAHTAASYRTFDADVGPCRSRAQHPSPGRHHKDDRSAPSGPIHCHLLDRHVGFPDPLLRHFSTQPVSARRASSPDPGSTHPTCRTTPLHALCPRLIINDMGLSHSVPVIKGLSLASTQDPEQSRRTK